MTKTLITSIIPRVQRAPLKSGGTVLLELNQRERDLVIAHSLADESLTNRLQITQPPGQRPKFQFTLDELDELAGNLAAEANHSKNKVLQEQLDQLCDRIEGFLTRYTHRDA